MMTNQTTSMIRTQLNRTTGKNKKITSRSFDQLLSRDDEEDGTWEAPQIRKYQVF